MRIIDYFYILAVTVRHINDTAIVKCSQKDLEKRGFLKKGIESEYLTLSLIDKLELLKSNIPTERTLGARLLSQERHYVADKLVYALKVEKKLYSKIEICKALVCHKNDSITLLIEELGKIGTNQHESIPDKEFCKVNYPLPRDIAGRTLANVGKSALPGLLSVLENSDKRQVSEAIDAIGFICFYDNQPQVFDKLKNCYIRNSKNSLICWKIVRAMSGFSQSILFLSEQKALCRNERIRKEINRSLRLIEKRRKYKKA